MFSIKRKGWYRHHMYKKLDSLSKLQFEHCTCLPNCAALPEIIKLIKMGKDRLKLSLMLREDYGG